MADTKTATEVLIEAMERFGETEGVGVVVISYDVNGGVAIFSNLRRAELIGLAEMAKHVALSTKPE